MSGAGAGQEDESRPTFQSALRVAEGKVSGYFLEGCFLESALRVAEGKVSDEPFLRQGCILESLYRR